MNFFRSAIIFCCFLFIMACKKDDTSKGISGTELKLDLSDTVGEKYFSRSTSIPGSPNGSSYPSHYDKKAILGRVLFYDKQLSVNNTVACASCHKQQFAFADNVAGSRGFEGRITDRNSMAIQDLMPAMSVTQLSQISSFVFSHLFWDGRLRDLKDLSLTPVGNHIEMGFADVSVLAEKLNELDYYAPLARDAFGSEELTNENIAEALAFFMLSITADSTRFNKHMTTNSEFTALEEWGRHLFNSKYDCSRCHRVVPGHYTGNVFANIGLDIVDKDKGLAAVVTSQRFFEIDPNGAFKAPNLKNVALTAPYMHDGRYSTLEDVIDHYSNGIQNNPALDNRLKDEYGKPMRMNISENEKHAIIAFLSTLTDHSMITDPKLSNPFKIVQ